jgi:hypothetical protein
LKADFASRVSSEIGFIPPCRSAEGQAISCRKAAGGYQLLSVETLRASVQKLRDAAARLDQELIKAGDLPAELWAEVLLLILEQKDKLLEATEEVREKAVPLFAAANRVSGATSAGDHGSGARRRKGVS